MTLLTFDDWQGKVWSGGWRIPAGGERAVIEPATGNELGRIGIADAADIAAAAEAAAAAQTDWAKTPFEERRRVMLASGNLIRENAEEIVGWLVRESGSVAAKAGFEIYTASNECDEAAALPSQPYGELLATAQPRFSFSRRRPVGVVGVIAPFNAPLILSIRSVAPALALGNAVVLKPDPRTGVCGGLILARVFEAAGPPPNVFHVLAGGANAGSALVEHPRVRTISFTGSTAAGRAVGELAARHLKRAHLELGGNSALVVLDDADLVGAVGCAAFGSFFHQGQVCMTTGRHIVHRSLVDEYIERLADKASGLNVGDPTRDDVALGPLIDATQRDRVHSLVSATVDAGARLAAGGTYEQLFYRPTVLAMVDPGAPAYAEEVFGPVAPVLAFTSLEEAAALASATEYGLSLGIVSANPLKALELAELIPSGAVHINDQTVNDEASIPFGGVGDSGTGARFGGARANIEAFTETQWVTIRSEAAPYPY